MARSRFIEWGGSRWRVEASGPTKLLKPRLRAAVARGKPHLMRPLFGVPMVLMPDGEGKHLMASFAGLIHGR